MNILRRSKSINYVEKVLEETVEELVVNFLKSLKVIKDVRRNSLYKISGIIIRHYLEDRELPCFKGVILSNEYIILLDFISRFEVYLKQLLIKNFRVVRCINSIETIHPNLPDHIFFFSEKNVEYKSKLFSDEKFLKVLNRLDDNFLRSRLSTLNCELVNKLKIPFELTMQHTYLLEGDQHKLLIRPNLVIEIPYYKYYYIKKSYYQEIKDALDLLNEDYGVGYIKADCEIEL